jgi:hypothetical protein
MPSRYLIPLPLKLRVTFVLVLWGFSVVYLGLAGHALESWVKHRPLTPQAEFLQPVRMHGAYVYVSNSDLEDLRTKLVIGILGFAIGIVFAARVPAKSGTV